MRWVKKTTVTHSPPMLADKPRGYFRKAFISGLGLPQTLLLTVGFFCTCALFSFSLAAAYQPSWPVFSEVRGGEYVYVVKKKDSLYAISGKEGTRWQYLAEINNLLPPFHLSVGQKLTVNNRHIFPQNQKKEGLLLNIPGHMLYLFENGEISQRFPVGVGRPDWPTPTGSFRIIGKFKNPTWKVPKSIQEEMEREGKVILEKVPPGPDNPLGKFWLPLSLGGYGIHATPWPESVGHSTSHGCIRMVTKDIESLYNLIRPGTPLTIVYEPLKLAVTSEGRIFLEIHPNTYQKPL
ncbi:MAG: L,D-transpeptidase family protein, partial [Thermodesulfobacteriota bacterium]